MTENAPDNIRPAPFLGSEFPDEEFGQVRDLLLERIGFDLGSYKDRCVKRRIAKRVRALGLADAGAYLQRLRQDASEVEALMTALTIHVSQFFRNPSTFAELAGQVLPELFRSARQSGRRELRLWSVGCAGGEEPYSLALLIDELAPAGLRVNILGTDVSPVILERAREGLFPTQRVTEVSAQRQEKYFRPEGFNLRLEKRIRNMVRFEHHNVLTAEAYPQADLILCRNVLIYFSRTEQEKILARFAQALTPGGYLVLGKAETMLGEVREQFRMECPEERIYRRLEERP